MFGTRMVELDVIEKSEYKFSDGIILPILVHIKDVDGFAYSCGASDNDSYVYKIKEREIEIEHFFKFIDIDIMNREDFEMELSYELHREPDGDVFKFTDAMDVYRFVISQCPNISEEIIFKFKQKVSSMIIEVINKYIRKLKELIGLGCGDYDTYREAFAMFQLCYGNGCDRIYFKENKDRVVSEYSIREILAMKFYSSREYEIENLVREEAKRKQEIEQRTKNFKGRGRY